MIGAPRQKWRSSPICEALSRRVAAWLLELAVAKEGTFAVCLSGGSTPQGLYEHLAGAPYLDAFPWSRTHWFWGDERFVPHNDALSNYRMARERCCRAYRFLPTTSMRFRLKDSALKRRLRLISPSSSHSTARSASIRVDRCSM